MPSIDELKALVKEFRSQGVSDEEIRETLREMNVGTDIIESLLGGVPQEEQKQMQEKEEEPLPHPDEIPVPSLPEEPPEGPREVEVIPQIETTEHVKELHKKIDSLHEKVPTSDDIALIKERLDLLQEDIQELKGMMKGLQKLLQEILNTERNILVDLYEKTKNC